MRSANEGRTRQARQLRRTQTDAERKLWHRLNNRQLDGCKFVRLEPIGPYIAGFACRERKLIVELDGSQHVGSEHDRRRDAYLTSLGYRVLRFWNAEAMTNMNSVLETIYVALQTDPRTASPRVRGEGFGPLVGPEASATQRSGAEGAYPEESSPETPPHPVGFADSPLPARGER